MVLDSRYGTARGTLTTVGVGFVLRVIVGWGWALRRYTIVGHVILKVPLEFG